MIFRDLYQDVLFTNPSDLCKLQDEISENNFENHLKLIAHSGIKSHVRYNKQVVVDTIVDWLITFCENDEFVLVNKFDNEINRTCVIQDDKIVECYQSKYDTIYLQDRNQYANRFDQCYDESTRTQLKQFNVDIVFPKANVALAINMYKDSARYYLTDKKFVYERTEQLAHNHGIRVINIFEDHFLDLHKLTVLQDIIKHALHKTTKRIYARDTEVVIGKAIDYKWFFDQNNIQSYRTARTAFMLVLKKDKPQYNLRKGDVVMGYTVGTAHFGKGKYDAEIARGACLLGHSVVGGASKLWKAIIEHYTYIDLYDGLGSVESIVYYSDNNYYDGQSVQLLPGNELIGSTGGFWNYWCDKFVMKNREPMRHHEVVAKTHAFKQTISDNMDNFNNILYSDCAFEVWNAGTHTFVWERSKQQN